MMNAKPMNSGAVCLLLLSMAACGNENAPTHNRENGLNQRQSHPGAETGEPASEATCNQWRVQLEACHRQLGPTCASSEAQLQTCMSQAEQGCEAAFAQLEQCLATGAPCEAEHLGIETACAMPCEMEMSVVTQCYSACQSIEQQIIDECVPETVPPEPDPCLQAHLDFEACIETSHVQCDPAFDALAICLAPLETTCATQAQDLERCAQTPGPTGCQLEEQAYFQCYEVVASACVMEEQAVSACMSTCDALLLDAEAICNGMQEPESGCPGDEEEGHPDGTPPEHGG